MKGLGAGPGPVRTGMHVQRRDAPGKTMQIVMPIVLGIMIALSVPPIIFVGVAIKE